MRKAQIVLGITLLAALVVPRAGRSQDLDEVRILTVVDYVAGNEFYLASGTDHLIQEGDTLSVYDGEGPGAGLLGIITIQSATDRRSVATFVGTPFSVARTDFLFLGLPQALADARRPDIETVSEVPLDPSAGREPQESGPEPPPPATPRPPVQIHGRAYLDMDALQTTTRWGEAPDEEAKRAFSTPTFRLQARARDLPGGTSLNTSLRLSHRTSPNDLIQPVTSLRFYQFDLEKRFEAAPIQLHLGRFHNTFDDFSGYLDGMMVHLGEEGLGAGVAVGFEPNLWNEGFSSDLPKVSGFVDYEGKGERTTYSGALSFSTTRPTNGLPDQTYLGLSQRVRVGGAWIRQRLRVDQSANGADWELSRLQLDASVPLSPGLSAHGGWRRWRASTSFFSAGSSAPLRDRANVGMSYWGMGGGLSANLSLDRPEIGDQARTATASFFLRRTPLLGLGFSGTASHWTRGEKTSLILSPEVRRALGPAEVRGTYRFYQTVGDFGTIRNESADLALTIAFGRGLSARFQGFVQWGENLDSNRLLVSLWKSF